VFGMLADKDIAGVVEKLKGRVDNWHLATLPGPRGVTADRLAEILAASGVEKGVFRHDSPAAAYEAARAKAGENDRIVVFGSFLTVTDVMQSLNRRPADH
jgi:dihydrofolate synthase/folylpolyglutamate synthase